MEQIKYQGAAQKRGFNPIQVSTASVDAIDQQGQGLLRQMRSNQAIEKGNRDAFEAATRQNQNIEAQNRADNSQFAREVRARYQEALQQNVRTQITSSQRSQQNLESSFQALSSFSNTIAKTYKDWKKGKDEEDMWDEYNKAIDEGLPVEKVQATQVGLAALDASNERLQQAADAMQAGGAPPETVFAVRKLSPARTLGRAKAMAELGASRYSGWLSEQLASDNETQVTVGDQTFTPAQASTPELKQAAAQVLRKKFMTSVGMVGMKPEILATALGRMRIAEAEVMDNERRYYAIGQSDQMKDESRTIFESEVATAETAGTGFTKLITNLSRTLDRNGRPLGYSGAWEEVTKILKEGFDAGRISEEALTAIENSATPDQPTKTYGERFRWRFDKLREELKQGALENFNLSESERRTRMQQAVNDLRQQMAENGPPNAETIKELQASFFRDFGEVPDFLKTVAAQYTEEAMDADRLDAEFEQLAQRHALTPEMVIDPRVPFTLQQKWKGEAERQVKALTETGDYKSAMKQIEMSLTAKVKSLTPQGEPISYTYQAALARAQGDFMSIVAARIKMGDTASEAQQAALKQIIPTIEQQSGGIFAIDPTGSTFTNFELKRGDGSSIRNAQAHFAAISSKITTRGTDALDRERLIPSELLQEADSKRDSPSYKPPPIAQHISRMFGGRISSWDVLNRQLQAQGFPPINAPPPVQVAGGFDPRYSRFLNYYPTGNRTGRAMMSYGEFSPDLVPGGYGQMIAKAAARNGVHPGLLAGLIATESSFNPNAVSRSGAVGLGQIMPGTARELGVDPSKPEQSVEGAARYLKQMLGMFNNDLTAGLRAYNQGPGNQQRYPNGVSSEAVEYPGKVLKAAAKYGFNSGGGSVWRNSATMNTNVANYLQKREMLRSRNGRLGNNDLTAGANGARLNTTVAPYWNNLVAAARRAGINISVNNSYRTYDEQARLYATKPKGMAAPPGGSNHGLGEAVDVNIPNDKVFNWLSQNARRFGFKNLKGEDWHWEFDPKLL
jgi:hypothetical protein